MKNKEIEGCELCGIKENCNNYKIGLIEGREGYVNLEDVLEIIYSYRGVLLTSSKSEMIGRIQALAQNQSPYGEKAVSMGNTRVTPNTSSNLATDTNNQNEICECGHDHITRDDGTRNNKTRICSRVGCKCTKFKPQKEKPK